VPICALKGLGARSQEWLKTVGIHSLADLKKRGSVETYLSLEAVQGKVSLNLLYAMEGALQSKPWQQIARDQKTELLAALDAAKTMHRLFDRSSDDPL
jgi:DNA transformation protein